MGNILNTTQMELLMLLEISKMVNLQGIGVFFMKMENYWEMLTL